VGGPARDVQPGGDVAVGQAGDEQIQNLQLAFGEAAGVGERSPVRSAWRPPYAELTQPAADQATRGSGAEPMEGLQGGDQFAGVIAVGSGARRLVRAADVLPR